MNWFDIVKAPPIENPRKTSKRYPNNNLSYEGYERLFKEKVDPKIRNALPSSDYVIIFADSLDMSQEKLLETLKIFYTEEMGYSKITSGSGKDVVRIYFE